MLTPIFRLIALPLIALAVIASLPAPATDTAHKGMRQVAAPEFVRNVTKCDGAPGVAACAIAANSSLGVVQ